MSCRPVAAESLAKASYLSIMATMHRSNWFLFCLTDGERAVPNWQPVMLSQFHDGRHDMGPDGFIKDDNMPKDARLLGETRPAKLAKFA